MMMSFRRSSASANDSNREVQEEKKDDSSCQDDAVVEKISDSDKNDSGEERKGDEQEEALSLPSLIEQSPTHVTDTKYFETEGDTVEKNETEQEALQEKETEELDENSKLSKAALVSQGVNLLDQLENEYRLGLQRRISDRTARDGDADDEEEEEEDTTNHSEESSSRSSWLFEGRPKSPNSQARWNQRRILFGKPLTHEQALEMTVDKLSRQLAAMEEERDALMGTVHTLQGKVEAQAAKIEALEHFFRRVNHRDDDEHSLNRQRRRISGGGGWEETSTTSFLSCSCSSSDNNASEHEDEAARSQHSNQEQKEDEQKEQQTFEDDEAWELEDAPPKLSVSFAKTGQKMRSAKTRAAAKMAKITYI